jgi:hypothetical protein
MRALGAEAPRRRPQATRSGVDPGNRRPQADRMSATLPPWYRKRYRRPMALNLRLTGDLADGLRALSADTGRSQQELIREAIADLLRGYRLRAYPPELRHSVTPAEQPYAPVPEHLKIRLPEGVTLESLLDELRR